MSPRHVRFANGDTERADPAGDTGPDFRALFEATPGIVLVLAPDAPWFTMLAASDERLAATLTTREQIVGRPLFAVFADANPENHEPSGVTNLRASLETVLRTRAEHRMAVQRYDLQRADGTWEERHWAPRNLPVLGPDGAVRYIVHHVEDVTEAVTRAAAHERLRGEHAESEALRRALEGANAQLRAQQHELELANQQLQDQAAELELQAKELQATTGELEERTEAAELARAEVDAALPALAASEARFRTVQDASPLGFCIHRPIRDASGAVVDFVTPYINAAGARIVGQSPERVMSERLLTIWPMAGAEGIVADYVRVLATGVPNVRELLYEHEELAAGLTLTAVRIGDGPDAELGITFTDATARLRAERERDRLVAALGAERERLRAVILHMPAPLALLEGPEHRFTLVNTAHRRISGGGRDVTGLTPREAYPELAGTGIFELFDRVWASGEAWVGPETHVRYDRDGTGVRDVWMNARIDAVRDAAGAVVALLNFNVDVTDQVLARREVERLLAESEDARTDAEAARMRSEAVLASIADAFYLLDRDWRFIYVNAAAEPLLRTTRERLLGRTLWEAFPDVVGSPFEAPYREAMTTGRPTSAEAYFAPLGTWFDVRSYAWPGGLMVHFRDIGARKAAEAERERLLADAQAARREAEAANRAKGEFLAIMSHELRTPLNAIGGYAELMEMGIRGPVTAQQVEDLGRIQRSQRHLLGLVNEVLNYAKLEAGTVRYDLTAVTVCEALAEAEALVAPQARARGLVLATAECPPTLAVRADAEKLRQVLVNVLSNAVKFTDPGGRVTVACSADPADGARVRIEVRDTGIGIAAEKLEAVFEPFVQVRADLTRTAEGTGLGLAISRDLARGMGGDLEGQSTWGVGSTFTLTLPRA